MTASGKTVEDAIFVDEVGLSYARRGEVLFKAAYQTVHVLAADGMRPWAVEGSLRAVRIAGAAVQEFNPVVDENFSELSLALQIRNFRDLGEEGLLLLLNFDRHLSADLDDALALLRFVAVELLRADIDPRKVICTLSQDHGTPGLPELIEAVHREGMALALENFGARAGELEETAGKGAAYVRFDPRWLRQVAGSPAALKLLGTLLKRLAENHTTPIAAGMEDAASFKALVEAGIRHFQGDMLTRPALAGTIFSTPPIPLSSLLPDPANIVPLFPRH